MTPAARLAAAAALLDEIGAGMPTEKVLTRWGRGARYAGSGDRAAVRDIVFDVLRTRRSCAARGGGSTGRALVLGLLRERGDDPAAWFTGTRHALPALAAAEAAGGRAPEGWEALDMPDWLGPALRESLGEATGAVCRALRERAPLFLRWHERRADAGTAVAALSGDGIVAAPHPLAPTALVVREGARRLRQSRAYREGLVELQDAASQAVCAALPAGPGLRVLDYCAGGGGKALALAARGAEVVAHDADPARMADLPERAGRAGDAVRIATSGEVAALGPYALVLADVPCSGSGAWRRQAEAKWRLTREGLDRLVALQARILDEAAARIRPGGQLAYATCSLLREENETQVARFLARAGGGWTLEASHRFGLAAGGARDGAEQADGDGLFLALMRRSG
ncbi:RsmB/NOP family class I SAM-dependent RNA methyltransferase [Rhodovulum sp. 12E13]|uniref:RsmB/NOP family class I SAM-dependent RNA methyltransferase n=1 Tax=Rhodovulum sp. 12E13 TaxID=2203891 RepID=UPI000E14304B|nr:RsmB/NOP family class I SAM-dependent RNA methyltransferase [Rhodovulum sp. 12E13]RDC73061.1 RsmB/NOP family class I SAM-dependent RNA methyltransferase [Rhodovulum sp. 12E13]